MREGTGAGGDRDYVTSVELGSVFARCLVRSIEEWRDQVGVNEIRLADVGGGRGALLGHASEMIPQGDIFEGVVVDVSPQARELASQRGLQAALLLEDLPWCPNVIVAHELIDNMPARLLAARDAEVVVLSEDSPTGGLTLRPEQVPVEGELRECGERWYPPTLPPDAAGILPIPIVAKKWIETLTQHVERPALLTIVDYGATAAELAARSDWPVRAYRGHQRVDPFRTPQGSADITCDVPHDIITNWLQDNGWTTDVTTQAGWLKANGIDDIKAKASEEARAAAQRQDVMTQLQAKSELTEIQALLNPESFGSFFVIQAEI